MLSLEEGGEGVRVRLEGSGLCWLEDGSTVAFGMFEALEASPLDICNFPLFPSMATSPDTSFDWSSGRKPGKLSVRSSILKVQDCYQNAISLWSF